MLSTVSSVAAVAGISCIRPSAPLGERASLRNPDSTAITALSSARSTPESSAACAISPSCRAGGGPSQGRASLGAQTIRPGRRAP